MDYGNLSRPEAPFISLEYVDFGGLNVIEERKSSIEHFDCAGVSDVVFMDLLDYTLTILFRLINLNGRVQIFLFFASILLIQDQFSICNNYRLSNNNNN